MLKSKPQSLALALALVIATVMPAMALTAGPALIGGQAVESLDTGEYFATIQGDIDDTDTLDGHTLELKVARHVTSGN